MRTNTEKRRTAFERSFSIYFSRVYAYALRRTQDHAAAQRVARAALVESLPALVDADEAELAPLLLRATQRSLRSEPNAAGGDVGHGSESLPPTSSGRPATSVTRATSSPCSSNASSASGAK